MPYQKVGTKKVGLLPIWHSPFLFNGVKMQQQKLSFYLIETAYCDYLRNTDQRVPYNMNQKAKRPFVGIILVVNNISYYAPLSSPKPKHINMCNQIDLIKINNGLNGVINLNNMIPVHKNSVTKVNLKPDPNDTPDDTKYKTLLRNQLTWCNKNNADIVKQAQKLYNMISSGKGWAQLTARCCDFVKCEDALKQYCLQNQWSII